MFIRFLFLLALCASTYCLPWIRDHFEDDLETLKKNRSLSEELTLFEGDLVLRDSVIDRVTEYGTVLRENTNGTRKDGDVEAEAMTRPYWYRWGGAVVPYQIDRSLKCKRFCAVLNPEKIIKGAMREWSEKTCIRFRPRRFYDRNWVLFKAASNGRCASEVGRVGGMQYVWLGLGCHKHGIVLHEIGHTLGFFHEQSRPDRDQYININWNNIYKKHHRQFQKYDSFSDMGTPYDYDSLMHYGKNEFRKPYKWFRHSITTKKKWNRKLGQRKYVSKIDAEEMNLYYGCPKIK